MKVSASTFTVSSPRVPASTVIESGVTALTVAAIALGLAADWTRESNEMRSRSERLGMPQWGVKGFTISTSPGM
jgi:hypothetical protein